MYFDDYSHETAGCVLMTISLEHLLDICTINSITDDMYVFITDSDNEVFLHTKNLHYGADFQPSFSYDTSKYASVIQIFDANMDGRQVSIACAPIAANGWTVYAVVPSYSMLKGTVISGIIILLSILVMLFICAVILIRVSMNISGPIQKLIYAMQNTGQGNLSEELALTLSNRYQFDEFRSLERGFNKMQKHLRAYIQEVSDYQYKQTS